MTIKYFCPSFTTYSFPDRCSHAGCGVHILPQGSFDELRLLLIVNLSIQTEYSLVSIGLRSDPTLSTRLHRMSMVICLLPQNVTFFVPSKIKVQGISANNLVWNRLMV
jgi:hypothetical protein